MRGISDGEILRTFAAAVDYSAPCVLVNYRGYLIDMIGWGRHQAMRDELFGVRWQEYILPADIPGLLFWLKVKDPSMQYSYRFKGRLAGGGFGVYRVTMRKLHSPRYRLLVGAQPVVDGLGLAFSDPEFA